MSLSTRFNPVAPFYGAMIRTARRRRTADLCNHRPNSANALSGRSSLVAASCSCAGAMVLFRAKNSRSAAGRIFRSIAFGFFILVLSKGSFAQSTDNPSDISPTLLFTTSTGITTPLPGACSPSGSLNPASGTFTLNSFTATPSALVAPPVCGNYIDLPPAPPNPGRDVWFRLDPPGGATRFRFTILAGTPPALGQGGAALYEAPSASGPFRLIECSTGGSLAASLPTVEANCITPGNKLYLRVWDKQTRNSTLNFTICVQGQTDATMPPRGAEETACSATLIPVAASTSDNTNIEYVFACEESDGLQSNSEYVGGDLWAKLIVPPSGVVRIFLGRGSVGGGTAYNVGVTTYLSPNCSDPTLFREVGSFTGSLPGSPSTTTQTFQVSCLTPGETLYVRFHSFKAAQTLQRRYGRLRFRWSAGGAAPGTPPANNLPCGAIPLTFDTSCPATPSAAGNSDACNTPGIPAPSCGGFTDTSRDVWYSFTAPASGTVHIEATPGTGFPADPAMALYTTGGNGCNGRFTLIECNAQSGPNNSARIFRTGLIPGQVYFIRAWSEGAVGSFSLCISEPIPPAASCFYVISLFMSGSGTAGTLFMDVTINGVLPATTYATTGDPNETFLISIPNGATAFFEYYTAPGVTGQTTRQVYRLGDPAPLWTTFSGGAIAGPAPAPQFTFTLTNACQPITPPVSDCLGTETVCTPGTEFGNLFGALPPGNNFDLTAVNMGCLDVEDSGIAWMIFRPIEDGTVAFWFDGTTNAPTTDLDFAIWDAGLADYTSALPFINSNICAPNGAPVRCSSARRNYSTGLMPGLEGVFEEGNGGWGWLSPLPVLADHVYLIALVRGAGPVLNVQYQMRWTLYTDASGATSTTMLDCTPLVLPVELLFLQGDARNGEVDLTWATGSEKNSSHFLVERSANAVDFLSIGRVRSTGDSQTRTDYSFTDEDPMAGLNYYRIRPVDLDGSFELSNTIAVMITGNGGRMLVYPNPVHDRMTVSMDLEGNSEVDLYILDALGRVVMERRMAVEVGRNNFSVDTQGLRAGAYLVRVMSDSGLDLGTTRFAKD